MPKYLPQPTLFWERSYTTPKSEQASEIVRIAFGRFRRLQSRNSIVIVRDNQHSTLALQHGSDSRQVVKTDARKLSIKVFKVVNCSFILKLQILLPREIQELRTACKGNTGKTESTVWGPLLQASCLEMLLFLKRKDLIRHVFFQWHPAFMWLPDAHRNSQMDQNHQNHRNQRQMRVVHGLEYGWTLVKIGQYYKVLFPINYISWYS